MITTLIYGTRKLRGTIESEYRMWIRWLQSWHRALLHKLLRHPTAFILWPTAFFFVLSYPTLYALYASPMAIFSCGWGCSQLVKSVELDPLPGNVSPDFIFKSVWIEPSLRYYEKDHTMSTFELLDSESRDRDSGNALEKGFLLNVLQLQDVLLDGLNLYTGEISTETVFLHSLLEYWNHDAAILSQDKNVLRTIHSKEYTKTSVGLPMAHLSLSSGIVMVDGLIKSAESLQICIFYSSELKDTVDSIWEQNLNRIENHSELGNMFTIFKTNNSDNQSSNFKLAYKNANAIEFFLIAISPFFMIVYGFIALTNMHSVKSRTGLVLAQMVQLCLSILSSATVTSYCCRNIDLLQTPFRVTLFIVMFVCIENSSRIVVMISKTFDELSLTTRMTQAVCQATPISSSIVAFDLVALLIISPFVGSTTKQFCLFISLALVFDHILHITYFTTVLGVDIRRLELEDLMQRSNNHEFPTNSETHRLKPLRNGSMISSALFKNFDRTGQVSYRRVIGQYLLKIKLPFLSTAKNSFLFVIVLLLYSFKWTNGVTFHKPQATVTTRTATNESYTIDVLDDSSFNLFQDKRGFAVELSTIYQATHQNSRDNLYLSVEKPLVLVSSQSLNGSDHHSTVQFDMNTTYKFDTFYLFEFISCLTFVLSSASITLKYSMEKDGITMTNGREDSTDDEGGKAGQHNSEFHSKELVKGHFLDVVRLSTSACPFITSVGMDHKILVWSPMSNPLPSPTQLPVSGRFLPITNVIMSSSGSFITVFSKCGVVKCWSRASMSWIWKIQIDQLQNDSALESFFRDKTAPAAVLRKRTARKSKLSKETTAPEHSTAPAVKTTPQVETTKASHSLRGRTQLMSNHSQLNATARSSLMSSHNRSLSIDSTFDRGRGLIPLEKDNDKELIIVLKDGDLISVDCNDGTFNRVSLTKLPIACCKKLFSPRVNDRVVFITTDGSLVVATAINNKWKVRNVAIQTGSYNSGKSLATPAVISRTSSMNMKSLESLQQVKSLMRASSQATLTNANYSTIESETPHAEGSPAATSKNFSSAVMETVPFVGMVVRACGVKADLIDVQTGTLLKEFHIGQFKPSTFKVFHPEPSHCRFCGCASVSSFSFAYTELETNTLILHTFSIDNKAKNSICLRVERDPRETRCLGFASVTEHQHWLSNVEGWCATDLNMLMGVRRKEKVDISNASDNPSYSSSFKLLQQSSGPGASNRKLRANNRRHPSLSDIWEGWTMSAAGQVRYYDIPDGSASGLLIKRLGPVRKFGHKSIVVSFGNIMKILYLGNDNLIEEGEHDNEGLSPASQTSTTLSFINRRRKMTLMKYELTHSTNFDDSIPEKE